MFDRRKVSIASHDKAEISTSPHDGWRLVIVAGFLAIAGLLFLAPQNVYADVQTDQVCMEEAAGFGLVCTANDVRIAAATDIVIEDDGCAYPGDTVTFSANFELLLGAKARHDIGVWFAQDGDPNGDGAITGTCTVATPAYAPDPPWLDLDGLDDPLPGDNKPSGIQDTCGDLDDNHNPLFPSITLTVACIDPDNDGKLNLPNCTSWRQSGANELCTSPVEAFPGSPSKCRCDISYNIDIDVPPATIDVVKTATSTLIDPDTDLPIEPPQVNEPGGPVRFDVEITNAGADPDNPLDLNTCVDNKFGDLFWAENPLLSDNTCLTMDRVVGSNDTVRCHFTADVIGNVSDSPHVDKVVCAGTDQRIPVNNLEDDDKANVLINDVLPEIVVTKTADPVEVDETGGDVDFTFVVTNKSIEAVWITSLDDDIFGILAGNDDCQVGTELAPAGESGNSCNFTVTEEIVGNAGFIHHNWFIAKAEDDEKNEAQATNDAEVEIKDVPSGIEVTKTANPATIAEPGGEVTFSVTIKNISAIDTVTINSLTDDIHDILGPVDPIDPEGCYVPQTLAPGASYSCSFTATVTGNVGYVEKDTVEAIGVDDDENEVRDDDPAEVTITDVKPEASLTKTVTKMVVTYEVKVFNDSAVESVFVDALVDDMFNDLLDIENSDIANSDCALLNGESIPVGGSVSCTFDAEVDTSPHTNTVTATVSDDDGNDVTPAPTGGVKITFGPAP